MMKLACKGTHLEKLTDAFEGPTAIAIAYGDPIPDPNLELCMEPSIDDCPPPVAAPQLCWDDYMTA